ncbi:hypothetical protein H4R34_004068 [Dimargaris verticillata]|uniref:Uncharacterized protein n=1 Tax=Dimargaris verticillata TaxID=2761393 RepID=A0A9W8B172_9FUNG|nr:hypothetical protein H4R34_004068 [Dimargaris verticillata]
MKATHVLAGCFGFVAIAVVRALPGVPTIPQGAIVPQEMACFYDPQYTIAQDKTALVRDCLNTSLEVYNQCIATCNTTPLAQMTKAILASQTNCFFDCIKIRK